ncbi:hypothetical protein OAB85_05660 [Pseudomonadales bacterium]|nr:hypothetical protein [Pseudomonadales bacterium]
MSHKAEQHQVADDVLDAIDYCYEQGWTDGLPVDLISRFKGLHSWAS